MPWTLPRTWVANEIVTAAQLNTHVRDNLTMVRAGGVAMTSQIDWDFIYAANATQFGRAAPTGPGQIPIFVASGWIMSSLYPVGSVYINASVSTNPATLFGFGTWAAFGAGRVMVGLDAGQTEFDTAEETGGAKTHALTIAELAAHVHTVGAGAGTAGSAGTQNNIAPDGTPLTTSSVGSGTAHNNLQPYITVYLWKRTA